MEYKTLGRTRISVSAIGLGCEGFIGMTEGQTCRQMDYAIKKGINFIDMYSSNPDLRINIGKALKGRREQFVIQGHICTAWENNQYLRTRDLDKTKAAFEEQLRLLQTDYLDIGMIHYIDDEEDFHHVFNGPIMQIDVLLFSIYPCYDMQPATENVEDLWAEENYARELHNIDPERERLYELCEQSGVGIDVMKVYGGGDLLSEANSPFGKAFTPAQCIEYALTRPGVASVMIGCRNCEDVEAATAWSDATKEERDYTSIMQRADRFSWQGHCMYCGHCAPCSVGIDIASVNKYYNLTVAEGFVPETVREHYKVLPHHASECIRCGKCEKNCPFGVDIREHMRKAEIQFGY